MIFRMGTVLTTVGGTPAEVAHVKNLLTFNSMSVEEAFMYQRSPEQVRVHKGGEKATFSLFNSRYNAFPTGLVSHVAARFPYPIDYMDETGAWYGAGTEFLRPDILGDIELRPYQMDSVYNMLYYKRGVVQHPTGAGKTEVICAFIACLYPEEFPVLVLVHTKFLLEQMANRLEQHGIEGVAIYGGGRKERSHGVTVGTIQGFLRGLKDECPTAKLLSDTTVTVICDEAHHTGSQSFYHAGLNLLNARNRIGVTMQFESVPGVYNPFDLHAIGIMGPVIHQISPPYLRRHGWQSDPILFMLPTTGQTIPWRDWRAAYDEGIIRHQVRNSTDILLAKAASDAGRKVLIFVWQISHGLSLLHSLDHLGVPAIFCRGQSQVQYYKSGSLVSERWPFDRIQRYVDEPGGKITIGTSVIDEGADLPQTDVLIMAVAGKAFRRLRQRVGRGLRPKGGDYTIMFDHVDTHNSRLQEHADMRQHVWRFDSIHHASIHELHKYAGFEMPEYQDVYAPPTLKTTMPNQSVVPGLNVTAPMGLSM
jgi:superfamily II DNA or RNA helicase